MFTEEQESELRALVEPKHPGSICVANYKGGVGKTTLVCLLGYYLAEMTSKRVLLIDIDPQCSLSLAVGFDPEQVSGKALTFYNLVRPSKWTKIRKTNFESYIQSVPDEFGPDRLYIIPGSFEVDTLDMEIAKSLAEGGQRRLNELFLYTKQMLEGFDRYDYVLVDCPPNKMFLTQSMLRACSFYLPVTIPDGISVYGMPRLMRWVTQVPAGDRPKLLGYVLNAVNRIGGPPGGKVYSQQTAEATLKARIGKQLDREEEKVLRGDPCCGVIPRLDVIARFLNQREAKTVRAEFKKKTSGQPTVEECMHELTGEVLKRMEAYRAEE